MYVLFAGNGDLPTELNQIEFLEIQYLHHNITCYVQCIQPNPMGYHAPYLNLWALKSSRAHLLSESEEARTLAAAAMTSVRISGRSMLPVIGKVAKMVRQAALRRELEGCQLLASVWCHGLTVAQLRSVRASLPPTARLLVTKNSDVAGTRWEALRPRAGNERVALRAVRRDPAGAEAVPRLPEGVQAAAQRLHRRRLRGPALRARRLCQARGHAHQGAVLPVPPRLPPDARRQRPRRLPRATGAGQAARGGRGGQVT
jgi:hypothetical protein